MCINYNGFNYRSRWLEKSLVGFLVGFAQLRHATLILYMSKEVKKTTS
jgi:hypothetical protein